MIGNPRHTFLSWYPATVKGHVISGKLLRALLSFVYAVEVIFESKSKEWL